METMLFSILLVLVFAPHSLGKLIEWKQDWRVICEPRPTIGTPHSLGKLIEWKLEKLIDS